MLVPVNRAGSKPALFFIHGANGIMPTGGLFSRILGPEYPFYVIHAKGFDGSPPHETFDEMVDCYYNYVVETVPSGPVIIAAMCWGTLIGIDVARRLLADGRELAPVVLFDPPRNPFGNQATMQDAGWGGGGGGAPAPDAADPEVSRQLYNYARGVMMTHASVPYNEMPFDARDAKQLDIATRTGIACTTALSRYANPSPFFGAVEFIINVNVAQFFSAGRCRGRSCCPIRIQLTFIPTATWSGSELTVSIPAVCSSSSSRAPSRRKVRTSRSMSGSKPRRELCSRWQIRCGRPGDTRKDPDLRGTVKHRVIAVTEFAAAFGDGDSDENWTVAVGCGADHRAVCSALPGGRYRKSERGRACAKLRHCRPTGSGPRPTVVMLHGTGTDAPAFAREVKLTAIAQREGFVVVYPDTLPGKWWNAFPAGYVPEAKTEGERRQFGTTDDVAFVKALVADLVRQGVADPKRVYLGGISFGGLMAMRIVCSAPEMFAAVGIIYSSMPDATGRTVGRPNFAAGDDEWHRRPGAAVRRRADHCRVQRLEYRPDTVILPQARWLHRCRRAIAIAAQRRRPDLRGAAAVDALHARSRRALSDRRRRSPGPRQPQQRICGLRGDVELLRNQTLNTR